MTRRLRSGCALGFALASMVGAGRASADPVRDAALAEELFQKGKALLDEGRVAQACPLLAESQRLDPAGGTALTVGLCYEKLGKYATAWGAFGVALNLARRDRRADREQIAEARLRELRPKVPYLTLRVAPSTAGLAGLNVRVNGAPYERVTWGLPLPIDPGEVRLEADAPGRRPFRATMLCAEAAKCEGVVGELAPVLKAAPERPKAAEGARRGSTQRALGFATAGVGVLGLAAGAFFGVRAVVDSNESKDLCPEARCDDERARDLNDRARDGSTAATWALGAGAALMAAGLVLVFTAPTNARVSAEAPGRGSPARARLGLTPLHVNLEIRW